MLHSDIDVLSFTSETAKYDVTEGKDFPSQFLYNSTHSFTK